MDRVEAVMRVILDEGVRPDIHRKMLRQLQREWPALWRALDGLVRHGQPYAAVRAEGRAEGRKEQIANMSEVELASSGALVAALKIGEHAAATRAVLACIAEADRMPLRSEAEEVAWKIGLRIAENEGVDFNVIVDVYQARRSR